MIKVTQEDLCKRGSRELTSLFNLVQRRVGWSAGSSPEKSAALATLAMIRAEQQRRGLAP